MTWDGLYLLLLLEWLTATDRRFEICRCRSPYKPESASMLPLEQVRHADRGGDDEKREREGRNQKKREVDRKRETRSREKSDRGGFFGEATLWGG